LVVYLAAELITALTSLFITLRHPGFVSFDIAFYYNEDCKLKDSGIYRFPRDYILMIAVKSLLTFEVVVLLNNKHEVRIFS